jgi:hypothetical protein
VPEEEEREGKRKTEVAMFHFFAALHDFCVRFFAAAT